MSAESVEVDFPAGRRLRVLAHRARLHDFTKWEPEFLTAILAHLKPGMVVYDIGAEEGEFSALWAQAVGPSNVHLFEPTPSVWPNIRAAWEANHTELPGGCLDGFVGLPSDQRGRGGIFGGWPDSTNGPLQLDSRFSVVTERPDFSATTVDAYAASARAPDVIVCDVEGAEWRVFHGARHVLMTSRPECFVSIHPPGFFARMDPRKPADHAEQQEHLFREFAMAGYFGRFLAASHEAHWQFTPLERLSGETLRHNRVTLGELETLRDAVNAAHRRLIGDHVGGAEMRGDHIVMWGSTPDSNSRPDHLIVERWHDDEHGILSPKIVLRMEAQVRR